MRSCDQKDNLLNPNLGNAIILYKFSFLSFSHFWHLFYLLFIPILSQKCYLPRFLLKSNFMFIQIFIPKLELFCLYFIVIVYRFVYRGCHIIEGRHLMNDSLTHAGLTH